MSATTIAVASQKGGVGKTTVCLNLALAYAERGAKTLLMDTDPQGSIGLSLARKGHEWPGLADVLMQSVSLNRSLVKTKVDLLKILPIGRLDPVDTCEYEEAIRHPGVLKGVLDRLSGDFDRIIMDTPSGLGMIPRAVLSVVDFVLSPFQAEPLAFASLPQIVRTIDHVRKRENARLQLLGFLSVMVDHDNNASLRALFKMWKNFSKVLLTTSIARSRVFTKASEKGLPVAFLKASATEGNQFDLLVQELETIIRKRSPEAALVEREERQLL